LQSFAAESRGFSQKCSEKDHCLPVNANGISWLNILW